MVCCFRERRRGGSRRRYVCQFCATELSNAYNLNRHVRLCHSGGWQPSQPEKRRSPGRHSSDPAEARRHHSSSSGHERKQKRHRSASPEKADRHPDPMVSGRHSPAVGREKSVATFDHPLLFVPLAADLSAIGSRPPSSLLDPATPKHVSFEGTSASEESGDDFGPPATQDDRPVRVRGVRAAGKEPVPAAAGRALAETTISVAPPAVVPDAATSGVVAALVAPSSSGMYETVSSASSMKSPPTSQVQDTPKDSAAQDPKTSGD